MTKGKLENPLAEYLMTGEVCRLLNLAPSSLIYHVEMGRLRPVGMTTDGKRLFAITDVMRFQGERKRGLYQQRGRRPGQTSAAPAKTEAAPKINTKTKRSPAPPPVDGAVPEPKGPTRAGR